MPQQVRVLQCYNCRIYQVDLVKKANKWTCKVCNAKQSMRCEHFRGSGPECRKRVQDLNKQQEQIVLNDSKLAIEFATTFENDYELVAEQLIPQKMAQSKWSNFVEENNTIAAALESNNNKTYSPNTDSPICFQSRTKWEKRKSDNFLNSTKQPSEESDIGRSNKKACKWDSYL